ALSYTWGDQDDPDTMELNGHLVPIGRNPAAALRHLRIQDIWVCLWVDALCIDQQDDVEKSLQVQRMPIIYEATSFVVIWLGTGFDGVQEAFSWLQDRSNFIAPPRLSVAEALTKLLTLPWWRRGWVIQELTVCQEAVV
ncbi:heterokaryon incompatibility, partial [Setomelanomma holmii]